MILAGVEHWVRIGFDFSQEKTTLRTGRSWILATARTTLGYQLCDPGSLEGLSFSVYFPFTPASVVPFLCPIWFI
jgi:hypothetical protein